MHPPIPQNVTPFPVVFKPYIVAGWEATRTEMLAAFGPAHYAETDSTRTFGGDEDCWAWDLASGHRIMMVLQVPYGRVELYCDPPNAQPALDALGIEREVEICEPYLDPSYSGPR